MREVILELPQYPCQHGLWRHPLVLPVPRAPRLLLPTPMQVLGTLRVAFVLILRVCLPPIPPLCPLPFVQPRFRVLDIRPSPPPPMAHRARLRIMIWGGEEQALETRPANLRERCLSLTRSGLGLRAALRTAVAESGCGCRRGRSRLRLGRPSSWG